MYEIWLVVNILWEMALGIWPVLLGAALIWLVLVLTAARRPGSGWRAALPWAIAAAIVVTVGATLALPGLSKSSLGEMGYWVDWANLLAMAAGFGALAAAFVWPLAALRAARH
jgi:hypothetical protein